MGVEVGKLEEELADKPGTTIGTKFFRITLYSYTVSDEMWFLTVDPLIWVSMFIAKLS